ncbi:MAG: hypothetical protein EHM72_18635 [Calditrichaeota bacterium]|nr:MAG: hypothetical protein EHM72_18635 [Calditrichota bacterium]
MNFNAKMVYTIDRDESHFYDQVKMPQFDYSLVAVGDSQGNFVFFDPGDKYLPIKRIAWYNEGTKGLIVGDMNRQFISLNCSKSNQNQVMRFQDFQLDDDLTLIGRITEKSNGQAAYVIRQNLSSSSEQERLDFLKKYLLDLYPETQIDSISINGLQDPEENLVIEAHRKIPTSVIQMGNHILLKPMAFIAEQENPFSAAERKFPIIFDYAKELTEIVRITLPPEWQVEALPEPITFSNNVGLCQITFESFEQSNLLNVQYRFILNSPFWKAESYADVRNLFEYRQTIEDQIVSLKIKEDKEDTAQ